MHFVIESSSKVHYYIGLLLSETSNRTMLKSSENWLSHESDHLRKEIPEIHSFLKGRACVFNEKENIPCVSPPSLS